jgi:hypothetical protein
MYRKLKLFISRLQDSIKKVYRRKSRDKDIY